MDQQMFRHLLDVFDNFRDRQYLQDVVYLDALQNLDEQNQDVDLTYQDAHLLHRLDVVVDEEQRHQLRKDYFQDAVDVELQAIHQQLRKDYFQDVEQLVYFLQLAILHLDLVDLAKKSVLEQMPQRFRRVKL
jgi:hypothetical protein